MSQHADGETVPPGYRTLAFDYTGGTLDPQAFEDLHDSVVEVFERHGLKVEGSSDGPMDWHLSDGRPS